MNTQNKRKLYVANETAFQATVGFLFCFAIVALAVAAMTAIDLIGWR